MNGSLTSFRWIDARDMSADAHTKGAIDREALLKFARGTLEMKHGRKEYESQSKLLYRRHHWHGFP